MIALFGPARRCRCLWLVLAVATASGCHQGDPADASGTPGSTAQAPYPALRYDTVWIEGQPEAMALRLFDKPSLPFVTYVPPGLVAEGFAPDGGTGARFHARFGSRDAPGAFVQIVFPAGENPRPSAAARLDTVVAAQGWHITARDTARGGTPCPWARHRIRFADARTSPPATGYACTGLHTGAPFYVVVRIPPEFGDGFGPRVEQLLSDLRWRDTGRGLQRE